MNNERKVIGILIVFSGISLVCLILTIILFINSNNTINNSEECIGTIVDFDRTSSGNSKRTIVSYEVNGQKYEFVSNFYSSGMNAGGRVEVLYNKNDYSDATIKSGVYIGPMITSIFTGAFSIPAIIMFILRMILKKKDMDNINNKSGYYITH